MKKCLHFILDVIFNYSFYRCGRSSGVERNLAKVDVEGSNPFTRSIKNPPVKVGFLLRVPFQTSPEACFQRTGFIPVWLSKFKFFQNFH